MTKKESYVFICGQTHTSDVDPDKEQNQTLGQRIDLPWLTVNICLVLAVLSLTGSRHFVICTVVSE